MTSRDPFRKSLRRDGITPAIRGRANCKKPIVMHPTCPKFAVVTDKSGHCFMDMLLASVACLFVLRQFEDVEIARIF
jgi:hypothetical protein